MWVGLPASHGPRRISVGIDDALAASIGRLPSCFNGLSEHHDDVVAPCPPFANLSLISIRLQRQRIVELLHKKSQVEVYHFLVMLTLGT